MDMGIHFLLEPWWLRVLLKSALKSEQVSKWNGKVKAEEKKRKRMDSRESLVESQDW